MEKTPKTKASQYGYARCRSAMALGLAAAFMLPFATGPAFASCGYAMKEHPLRGYFAAAGAVQKAVGPDAAKTRTARANGPANRGDWLRGDFPRATGAGDPTAVAEAPTAPDEQARPAVNRIVAKRGDWLRGDFPRAAGARPDPVGMAQLGDGTEVKAYREAPYRTLELADIRLEKVAWQSAQAQSQEAQRSYTSEVLQQEDVGQLAGERVMRMVLLTMQPGAEIPEHQHAGPGLRYVLDGAITIAWKDGGEKTFEAGTTYFEGPGANHPPGMISARNPTDGLTRVLIIETLPEQQ